MLRRLVNYIRTSLSMKAEQRMDPAVQIEQAVDEARRHDKELREQAARVIAHRSELQMKLDRALEAAAKAKASASQALMKVQDATQQGSQPEVERWTRAAQSLAIELETQERLVAGLKEQYSTANDQAEMAKRQVNENAMHLKQLSAQRMELLGKLEQAKMQEQVNKTLESLSQPLEARAPSLTEIEDKINRRMALASAQSELQSESIEGAQRELNASMREVAGQARLEQLRAELGMGSETASATDVDATPDEQALLDEGRVDTSATSERAAEESRVEQRRES